MREVEKIVTIAPNFVEVKTENSVKNYDGTVSSELCTGIYPISILECNNLEQKRRI